MDPATIALALNGVIAAIDYLASLDPNGNLPESMIQARTEARRALANRSAELAKQGDAPNAG